MKIISFTYKATGLPVADDLAADCFIDQFGRVWASNGAIPESQSSVVVLLDFLEPRDDLDWNLVEFPLRSKS